MENLNKRPSKGILRFSEGSSRSNSVEKDIKWDEANIKETLHPDDKEYGFMKIDEPPTPYSRSPHGHSEDNSDEEDCQTRTNELLERVSRKIKEPPLTIENVEDLDESVLEELEKQEGEIEFSEENESFLHPKSSSSNHSSSSLASTSHSPHLEPQLLSGSCEQTTVETPRSSGGGVSDFELKRKRHYNEFHAVKLAKKLMQQELDAEDDLASSDKKDESNDDDEEDESADNKVSMQ